MSHPRRQAFAEAFGFDLDLIDAMSIGCDVERKAWTFPMYAADTVTPVGVRMRSVHSGSKWALKGGKSGCFFAGPVGEDDLWVVEGPTDAAALACCGCRAVGLPSINSGYAIVVKHVYELGLRGLAPVRIVWVSENDDAGSTYKERVMSELRRAGRPVVSIKPPPCYKDIRDWYDEGMTKGMLTFLADQQETK